MPGPFYLAWVDATDTAFTPDHVRDDEGVFSFTVSQAEGDFAALEIDIRNPRVGLLSAGRKQWAWLSWDNGSDVVPLFFGRLVGIPNDIHLELVRLVFTVRPADYGEQKAALAETMRTPPFWDPVFIAQYKRDDPDVVLEARTRSGTFSREAKSPSAWLTVNAKTSSSSRTCSGANAVSAGPTQAK
jgi:hypothetical protein